MVSSKITSLGVFAQKFLDVVVLHGQGDGLVVDGIGRDGVTSLQLGEDVGQDKTGPETGHEAESANSGEGEGHQVVVAGEEGPDDEVDGEADEGNFGVEEEGISGDAENFTCVVDRFLVVD